MDSKSTAVREIFDKVKLDHRTSLTASEAKVVAEAYQIPIPKEAIAKTSDEAAALSSKMGFPVVLKIVSPEILHKTEAGGVLVGVKSEEEAKKGFDLIMSNAKKFNAEARLIGVQVQQMVNSGQEVIVGAVTDPSFGKLIAFGLGGILVEVVKDITFRLAPVTSEEALSMLDGISAHEVLKGVRGKEGVNRKSLADLLKNVSQLISDFPEISEIDLNPVFASSKGAIAADIRIILNFETQKTFFRYSQEDIRSQMQKIMNPQAVAVIGASPEEGKIGNSVMKNLINGGYKGEIYPIHPKADLILGKKVYRNVKEIPGPVDIAIFAVPAKIVPQVLVEVGEKKIPGAILIPSGFAETGNIEAQKEIVEIGRKYGVRLMGPNIYGFYYTPKNLCATFCTAYDLQGKAALSSQSGGIGMAIIGFSRSAKMGVSAIVGLGNKCDIDEDDLLLYFENDPNTEIIAQHFEDLKDGRAFAEAAKRVSKKKPIIALKAGRTDSGAKAASSHTGALAGNDKIYEDILKQAGVIRVRSLRDLLEFARAIPLMPTPKGENVVIITGAGGSGVLLSDACEDNGLSLMKMPADLDLAFRKFIPPFGSAGNPVDITGGEPPETYKNTIRLALQDPRIHSLILGYWHTIISPPMTFAKLVVEVVDEMKAKGIEKPVVASLSGDIEVEEAAEYLFAHGIPAYAYSTELPVAVLGGKYKWARTAGLIGSEKSLALDSIPTIRTERLILRPWRESDVELFSEINCDPKVMEFIPGTISREDTRRHIEEYQREWKEKKYGRWALELPGVSELIGYVGLHYTDFPAQFTPCIEIGWRLDSRHWGKGYASEAARAALMYGFSTLGSDEFLAFTYRGNDNSRKLMERLGMTYDPSLDFHLPSVPSGDPKGEYVVYRISRNHMTKAA